MNIEVREIESNNNDTEIEGYLRWIKSLKPKKSRDYMNIWHKYINDEPLKTIYQIDKEPYKYGNGLPPIITKLPGFMNTQMLLYELNKLRHKSFKFNGEAIEEEPTHPWDDDNLYNKLIQSKAYNTAPVSRNKRNYSAELLERIYNSAVLEDFKNKEFLGEYPHEQ